MDGPPFFGAIVEKEGFSQKSKNVEEEEPPRPSLDEMLDNELEEEDDEEEEDLDEELS